MSIEKNSLISLLSFSYFSPHVLNKLYLKYQSWNKVLSASYDTLKKFNLSDENINAFFKFKKEFKIDKVLSLIEKENINLLYYKDKCFPQFLKEIPDPPPLLFLKGNKDLLKHGNNFLTVVGSRKTNSYGTFLATELLTPLNNNIIIVSGLAYGIDSLAHSLALKSNKKTIAVLGSGLDSNSIYPKENQKLANDIIKDNGLIISEFPPLTPPLKHHFPRRNRLLAGLSLATLVLQAKKRSGALITAYMALDFNREVLSIPSNINLENSQGNNQLIKAGAKVVLNYKDIEESLYIDSF